MTPPQTYAALAEALYCFIAFLLTGEGLGFLAASFNVTELQFLGQRGGGGDQEQQPPAQEEHEATEVDLPF